MVKARLESFENDNYGEVADDGDDDWVDEEVCSQSRQDSCFALNTAYAACCSNAMLLVVDGIH